MFSPYKSDNRIKTAKRSAEKISSRRARGWCANGHRQTWYSNPRRCAATAAGHDVELLALGKQFDQLERQYHEVMERDRPRIERELQLLEAQERSEKVDEEFGPQRRPDALDILDVMDPPMRRIMALPATTLAGLAVKARVARFSCERFWDEPEEVPLSRAPRVRRALPRLVWVCAQASGTRSRVRSISASR